MGVPEPIAAALAPGAVPELDFAVQSAESLRPAASPTLRFGLRVDAGAAAVRSVLLDVQIRIAATQRGYAPREQELLGELFGEAHRWGTTLHSLLWTHARLVVPPFDGTALVDLDVPCTYDFEVSATKYLAALGDDGEVPLEMLFSGTVFHAGPGGLQVSRIGWDKEAVYRLPVRVWRETIDQHFPGSAWLRVDRAAFERLAAFKARHALTSWEAALDVLLRAEDGERA